MRGLVGFVISVTLAPRRQTGADEADRDASFKVNYHEHSGDQRAPDQNISRLADRVCRVGNRDRKRIATRRRGLFKAHTVLARIRLGLGRIPFELNRNPLKLLEPMLRRSSITTTFCRSGSRRQP